MIFQKLLFPTPFHSMKGSGVREDLFSDAIEESMILGFVSYSYVLVQYIYTLESPDIFFFCALYTLLIQIQYNTITYFNSKGGWVGFEKMNAILG